MKNYFAYGSNLHPVRLEKRLGKVEFRGIGKLRATDIQFNKTGGDGSGKATIVESDDPEKSIWGAIYGITEKQEKRLDKFEALGKGYHKITVEPEMPSGDSISCITYQGMPEYVDEEAVPFGWYKKLVIVGAEYLNFPENYVRDLKRVESRTDPNRLRKRNNQQLIKRMYEQ